MTTNTNIFANAYITEEWNGGYKIEVDLTSDINAQDWSLDFDLPYNIRAAYGADLTDNGNGNYTISGQSDWQTIKPGESFKAIFIVDSNEKERTIPKFTTLDTPELAPKEDIMTSSVITEDWKGGYKIEVDLTSDVKAQDWSLDFDLPYNIKQPTAQI